MIMLTEILLVKRKRIRLRRD